MALNQWAPVQNRSGSAVSPGVAPPPGAVNVYMQLDTAPTDFIDPAEILDFQVDWSSDNEVSYQNLAGGRFVGSATIPTKSGFRSVTVPVPPGCTQMRASYTVVAGAPIRFGLLGAFRDAAGADL